jgi:ABC-type taurine transport system substrate-binding protein
MAKKTGSTERKARVSRVPENESKEQKFIRLAGARVKKVLKALDQIGLLGGASYVSTDAQHTKIEKAIRESVDFNLQRLAKVKHSKSDFSL